MDAARTRLLEQAAALLERAYGLALVLQARLDTGDVQTREATATPFEQVVIARELVSILDDARATLVLQSGGTAGSAS